MQTKTLKKILFHVSSVVAVFAVTFIFFSAEASAQIRFNIPDDSNSHKDVTVEVPDSISNKYSAGSYSFDKDYERDGSNYPYKIEYRKGDARFDVLFNSDQSINSITYTNENPLGDDTKDAPLSDFDNEEAFRKFVVSGGSDRGGGGSSDGSSCDSRPRYEFGKYEISGRSNQNAERRGVGFFSSGSSTPALPDSVFFYAERDGSFYTFDNNDNDDNKITVNLNNGGPQKGVHTPANRNSPDQTISFCNPGYFSRNIQGTKPTKAEKNAPSRLGDDRGDVSDDQAEKGEEGEDCIDSGSFGWLVCDLLSLFKSAIENIQKNLIAPLLEVPALTTGGGSGLYEVWKVFRNIANVLFVLTFLFIIFAQAISFNVDAYTIKKMLPRLVIGVILVQLSFWVVGITVDIFNVLGGGIHDLVTSTLQDQAKFAVDGNVVFGALSGGAILGLYTTISVFSLLPILISGLLAAIMVFFVLIIRQVIIATFVVLSPIAFVAFVLPNTEGLFRTWWNWFINTLAIYPIIMLLLASSDIFGAAATGLFEGRSVTLKTVATLIATFGPLFLIPVALKVANGAMGAVVSGLQNMRGRAAGGADGRGGLRGWANQKADQLNREAKSGTISGNETMNKLAQGVTNPGSFIPSRSETAERMGLGGLYSRTAGRVGTRTRAQALTGFNQLQAQANETFDEEQVNDPRVLRGLVQHGESGPTMRNYINSLRERGQNDLADQMESVAGHAGKAAFLSAAATRLGESGRFNQEDADALVGTFSNNPALLQQTLGNAGYQNRKNGNIANSYWRALRDNEGNITSVVPDRERIRDQVSRMGKEEIDDERYLDQASPFMHEIFQGGGPQAQDLEVNLRQTLHPQSGIDATKRQQVRQILEQNGRPVEPMASPVNVEEVAGHQTQPGPTPDDPSLHVRVQQRSDQPPPGRDEGYL